MQLSKSTFATLFLLLVVIAVTLPTGARAVEEMCAFFEGKNATPTCETCVEAGCGWTADDGDCLKNCAEVDDGAACVSTLANCSSAEGGEEMCAFFEGKNATPTCETCVEAGCGWTADDGDCLKNCAEVNDGAACVSKTADCGSGGQTSSATSEGVTSLFALFLAAVTAFI